jgi:threonine aldolase
MGEMIDIQAPAESTMGMRTVEPGKPQDLAPSTPSGLINVQAGISQNYLRVADSLRETPGFSSLAWSHSNEASNDFRSDFFTKPTLPMLEAIITTSLGDGDMEEDRTTNSFQDYVAGLVGHEAALLVISGTMGNQVALRSALGTPPHSILADHRGHIIILEGGGAAGLCGAMIKMVVPSNGHHLTLDDVKKHSTTTESIYDCPTRVISLENTLWGTVMPISDIRAISRWARAQTPPIHMHLDGARLWEAAAAGACTLQEIGECFDSIQLCFTKGLGAPIGSIVTGSSAFIKRAKWSRKFLGGSTRSSGVIAAPARVAIDDVFFGGKLKAAQDKAKYASALWEELGGKLQLPTETNLIWLDIEASGLTPEDFYPLASKFDVKVGEPILGRVAFHYQITDAAFARLCNFFRAVLKNGGSQYHL